MTTVPLFVRTARLEPAERTPVWFMRQAGRVLPEYRALRERWTLMEICRRPELCAEVTLQPVHRMPLDAAVMFADIMLPLIGVGVEIELVDNVGPVVRHPIRSLDGLGQLRALEPEADVPFILEAARIVRRELDPDRAVIGFAGAPFTLAAYLVEGRPSRTFTHTKAMMYREPALWHALMDRLTGIMITYLRAKADAGVDALQLFDSWIGTLGPDDYTTYVQPYTRRIFAALQPCGLPLIHFGTNTATLLEQMRTDGASVIGVDWRLPLDDAWRRIGHRLGIQGNLDPAVLCGPMQLVEQRAGAVLRQAGQRPGHIFNLGHGVLPETPLDNLLRLVDFVQAESETLRGKWLPMGVPA